MKEPRDELLTYMFFAREMWQLVLFLWYRLQFIWGGEQNLLSFNVYYRFFWYRRTSRVAKWHI